jgi:hypothetical protein
LTSNFMASNLVLESDDSKVNSLWVIRGLGTSTTISKASREETRGATHQQTC